MTEIKSPRFSKFRGGDVRDKFSKFFFIQWAKCYTWLKSAWNSLSRGLKTKIWNSRRTTRQFNEKCEEKYDRNKTSPFSQISRRGMFGANSQFFFIEGAKRYIWLKNWRADSSSKTRSDKFKAFFFLSGPSFICTRLLKITSLFIDFSKIYPKKELVLPRERLLI